MNQLIAEAAKSAITDPSVTAEKGMCSRFGRQVTEKVYGEKFDHLFGATALETAKNFAQAGLARRVVHKAQPMPGDFLFKNIGPNGHLGIYVGHGLVAENSSTHLGRVCGAKGFRSLEAWGDISSIGCIHSIDTHA